VRTIHYLRSQLFLLFIWRKLVQVTRTGLYSREDELAGMNEANSDDAREPDWAPAADADSPDCYGEPGDVSGSRKLQSSRKRVKGLLKNLYRLLVIVF